MDNIEAALVIDAPISHYPLMTNAADPQDSSGGVIVVDECRPFLSHLHLSHPLVLCVSCVRISRFQVCFSKKLNHPVFFPSVFVYAIRVLKIFFA